ncbi:MAG: hypothetical protein WCP70_08800, partial [Methanothrix sp.]
SGQKERREHQKNRAGYEVESVLCEACLDALDENQDAGEPQQIDSLRRILAGGEFDAETTENILQLL